MHQNRLINEKSPYLLQHAHNPVDWHPWGDDAFEKARREDKPVFLSIGYSTCHWCHVMEEESFESEEVAKLMNEHFVSIKVDREERPDIDHIYMSAVTAMTGSGGWPLSVFLTPDKKPFYGGTYFPPDDRWGRPGFKSLLNSISEAWRARRKEMVDSAQNLTQAMGERRAGSDGGHVRLDEKVLEKAFEQFHMRFDPRFGGFGGAPKFPRSHELSFLLRYAKRSGERMALEMVERTLEEMAKGGIYDHLGGGFHRYSTDAFWHVPHFEKMLYDQALLARTYLEAYQMTKKADYAQVAREIFEYVLRDMTDAGGAFYSAEDADSVPPEEAGLAAAGGTAQKVKKKEGAFYIWSESEVRKALDTSSAHAFLYRYGVKPGGNVQSDPQGEFGEKNILYAARRLEETAQYAGKTVDGIRLLLEKSKELLFTIRRARPRPHLDDKILVDWNGLMIASLAFGSHVLNEPRYAEAAKRAADFILQRLEQKNGRLLHRFRDEEAGILGTLEDYAFFINGLIELYQATFQVSYLKGAKRLAEDMLALFWDEKGGGFFLTADDAEPLILRPKELYDGALPSGNSMAALDLIWLGRLTMSRAFEDRADQLIKTFSPDIDASPTAFTQMLSALDFAIGPSQEIVISGDPDAKETLEMIAVIYSDFIPNKVVAFRPTEEFALKETVDVIAFLKDQIPVDGETTAYVCRNYVCLLPVTQPGPLKDLLSSGGVPSSRPKKSI